MLCKCKISCLFNLTIKSYKKISMNLILIKLECMCIFKVVLDISRSKIGSVRFVLIHHFIWGSELLIAFIIDWFETNDMHKLIVSALPVDI